MRSSRNPARILFAAALVIAATQLSCGLLGDTDNLLSFSVPVTWTLPTPLPIAYPGSDRLSELQNNNERTFPIFAYVPADLHGISDDIPGASAVEEVRITGVEVTISDNTLDTDIEPFEVRIGDPGTEVLGAEIAGDDWNNALLVAVTETAGPGFQGVMDADIVTENQSTTGRKIANLQFGIGIGTALVIPQGDIQPGGTARAQFTFHLDFVVKPL